jgi:hypothetical protein
MAEIYKAIFTCPELDEREVWYVSSRKEAQQMVGRKVQTTGSTNIQARYKHVQYDLKVQPVFEGKGDLGVDPRP